MAVIWPKVVVEENNLNEHILALRRVLSECPEKHRFIDTDLSLGHRFAASVRPVLSATTEPPWPYASRADARFWEA